MTEANTPVSDELRSVLRETGAQFHERALDAIAGIPMVLPGQPGYADVVRARQVAYAAVAASEAFDRFRSRIRRMLIAIEELETTARATEDVIRQRVLAECANIQSAIGTMEAVAGKQVH